MEQLHSLLSKILLQKSSVCTHKNKLAKVNRLAPELDYTREKAILLGNECERLTGENENYKNDLEKLKEHIANLESIEGEVGELRRQIDNIIYEKDNFD